MTIGRALLEIVFHNLRSALDHFIAALPSEKADETHPKKRSLRFPIADSPDKFSDQAGRIEPLNLSMKAEIDQTVTIKPKAPIPPSPVGLAPRPQYDRLLSVVLSQVGEGEFNFHLPPGSGKPVVDFMRERLEEGTEIAWFTIDPPQPNVQFEHKALIVITIGHVPGPSGDGRTEAPLVIDSLTNEVRNVIDILGRAV